MFAVGIVGPLGPGPLPRNPLIIETPPNDKRPPVNLTAVITDSNSMIITWQHNCLSPTKRTRMGPKYKIIVRELKTNKTSTFKLLSTSNETLSHTFVDVLDGAKYEVRVAAADIPNSESVNTTVDAKPLPMPNYLRVYLERNGTYVVSWNEIDVVDGVK